MGNTFKKVASLILVAVMIISGIPTMSFAETSTQFQFQGNQDFGSNLDYTQNNNIEQATALFDIMGIPGNNLFKAYCVDKETTIVEDAYYQPKFLEDISYIGSNAPKIRTIITSGYPNVGLSTLESRVNSYLNDDYFRDGGWKVWKTNRLTSDDAIAATQAAIWFNSNGQAPREWHNDQDNIKVVYNYLMSLPGTAKPIAANIETTPVNAKIENGNVIVTFTYKNAGSEPVVSTSLVGFTENKETVGEDTTITLTKALKDMTNSEFTAFNVVVKGTKQITDVFAFHPVKGTDTSQTLVSLGYTFDTEVKAELNGNLSNIIPKYTVDFIENGGTEVASKTVNFGTVINPLPTTTLAGHGFNGWFIKDTTTPFLNTTVIKSDLFVEAKWTPNTYKVTYDVNGGNMGTAPTFENVEYNKTVTSLPVPVKDGHTFGGWFINGTNPEVQFKADTKVTDHITVTAKWSVNTYTVTYNVDGGDMGGAPTSENVQYNNTVTSLPEPTRTGYTFGGWIVNGTNPAVEFKADTKVIANVTVTAKWIANPVVVQFNSNGGSDVADLHSFVDQQIGTLPVPTQTGFTFAGWYLENDPNQITSTYILTKDITLNARWTQITYTVIFDENGGSPVEDKTIAHNSVIDPIPTSTKDQFDLVGWYTDINDESTKLNADTKITENTTFYAKWTPKVYRVTFFTNGGTPEIPFVDVESGNSISKPDTKPVKDGYTFSHWALQGSDKAFDFTTLITESIILVAQYTKDDVYHMVTFDANGGAPTPSSVSVLEGTAVSEPETDPSKTGFTFTFWALQDNYEYTANGDASQPYDFTSPVNAPITLVAQYTEDEVIPVTHIVTFDTNGGTPTVAPVTVDDGTAVSAPTVTPIKDGYTFSHWALQESTAAYDFSTPVTAPITLVAQYIEITTEPPTTQPPTTQPPTTQPPTTQPPTTEPPTTTQPTIIPVLPVDPEVVLGIVRVEYVDAEGNSIADSFQFSGGVGTNYSTTPKTVEGYELSETPANATGVFTEATIVVTYVYSEPTEVIEEEEVAQGEATTEAAVEETTEAEVVDIVLDETPLADALPQTGQLPAELFYGAGSLITAIGVYLKKRK